MTHTCALCGSDRAFFGFGAPGEPKRDPVGYQLRLIWFCREHRPGPELTPQQAWAEAQRLRALGRTNGAPDVPDPPAAS